MVTKNNFWSNVADALVVPTFEGEDLQRVLSPLAPEASRAALVDLAHHQEFVGKRGQVLLLPGLGKVRHVILIGLGSTKRGEVFLEATRDFSGQLAGCAEKLGLRTAAVRLTDKSTTAEAAGQLVSALQLATYRYHEFKKEPKIAKLAEVTLVANDQTAVRNMNKEIEKAMAVSAGVNLARQLVNTPGQTMMPERLAAIALEVAENSRGVVKVKVLNKKECAEKKMGAFLAVAQGAEHEPKFIHFTYTSPRPTKKTLAIAGKGVTFDSGGLSLKPADSMMTMKCDMAGAAAVVGFFSTLAVLKPRVNIHGVIAATENMPSGRAIRPGDIVHASNGASIEILNTDAEGRLTLADALHYLVQLKPDAIIDLATLTGACVVALGEEISGLMTNDRKLGVKLLGAAKEVGEKMWELPLEPRYRDLIMSDIADYKNIAGSRYGGTLTAGLFLQEFVSGLPWAHIDIAGPAFAERPLNSYLAKGGTGYGVRTLVRLVEKY